MLNPWTIAENTPWIRKAYTQEEIDEMSLAEITELLEQDE